MAVEERQSSRGGSWLSGIGGKVAVTAGMLVIVGGAFLPSRRRGPSQGAAQDELERKRWEGNRRE